MTDDALPLYWDLVSVLPSIQMHRINLFGFMDIGHVPFEAVRPTVSFVAEITLNSARNFPIHLLFLREGFIYYPRTFGGIFHEHRITCALS